MFIVAVGETDHDHIIDPGALQHKRFKRPRSATIAIPERVYGTDMIVGGNALDYGVMMPKFTDYRGAETIKGALTFTSAFSVPVGWPTEADIPSVGRQYPGSQ